MYKVARTILLVAAVIGLFFVSEIGGLACCTCGGWNPTTIVTTGTTPFHNPPGDVSNWSMQSITAGTPVNVTASLGCMGCGANSYSWTVTRTFTTPPGCDISTEPSQVSSQPSTWSGSGPTATFTPVCAGRFTVEFKAKCGGNSCPADTVIVAIDSITGTSAGADELGEERDCSCIWNTVIVTWPGHIQPVQEGETINSVALISGDRIDVAPSVTCTPADCPLTYKWQVTPPGGSPTPLANPPISFSPTSVGLHTVYIEANCGETDCNPFKFQINIKNIEGGECGCRGWNLVNVTWDGSPPGTRTCWCGDTVTIDSVNYNTNVVISSSIRCSPLDCESTIYANGVSNPGPTGSIGFLVTEPISGYTATFGGRCRNTQCEDCNVTINILHIVKSPHLPPME